MPSPTAINLFKGRKASFIDKFINWALTGGRVIVIFTELLALLAFLYRFSLDSQIIDLHSKIKQELAVVKLLNNNENTYRNLQERLKSINTLDPQAAERVELIKTIYNTVPEGLSVSQMFLDGKSAQIDISVQSPQAVSSFVKSLKQLPQVKGTNITRVENKTSQAIILVGLTVTLK